MFQNFTSHIARKVCSGITVTCFMITALIPPQFAHAITPVKTLSLPAPGTLVSVTPSFQPPMIKGLALHSDNPLAFDFVVHPGERPLDESSLEHESEKLIKYFLAALTVPEDKLWVNLSPYENNRIIADEFGQTEMGHDLLAQDYMLKQLSASLMYPEQELGKEFWARVHRESQSRYGTTNIPLNTFNKVWIVPDQATVHQHDNSVFVVHSKLKVMLEEDYLALEHHTALNQTDQTADPSLVTGISSEIVKEILIPAIEEEVNNGVTFAKLRQIYNSLILATWYKKNLRKSLLAQTYVDQSKTSGIAVKDQHVNQRIYDQYIAAFKKGVYDYIREDYDPVSDTTIPRHYFSGGVDYAQLSQTLRENQSRIRLDEFEGVHRVHVNLDAVNTHGDVIDLAKDLAMASKDGSIKSQIETFGDQFKRYYEAGDFTSARLDQLQSIGMQLAKLIRIENIESLQHDRLAQAGGYDEGILLIRERDPEDSQRIVESNDPGRLLRDKTLQPRIERGVVFEHLGDWMIASESELYAALVLKLKEELEDALEEAESVVKGDQTRLNRLAVVITNYLEAIESLRQHAITRQLDADALDAESVSDIDSAMLAVIGSNQELNPAKWGSKGSYFKLLREIQKTLFPDRDDDLFPHGRMLSTDETRVIREQGGISDDKLQETIKDIEATTGKRLGDAENPLFLSVRSSPEFSMPDQLDTILNIGMTEETIKILVEQGADEVTVLNAYRRFIGHFAHIVMGIQGENESDLFAYELKVYLRIKDKKSEFDLSKSEQYELINTYKRIIKEMSGLDFPATDVRTQLKLAIDAITFAWDHDFVQDFRRSEGIADDSGYGVLVQEMKFGNLNEDSGSGVIFSRDPHSGEKILAGDFLVGRQGTAVVSGKALPNGIDLLQRKFPKAYDDLEKIARVLEGLLGRVVDIEFTIENGKLYVLQLRPATLKIGAERRVFEDFLSEGILNTVTKVHYQQRIQERIKRRHVMKVKDDVEIDVLFSADVSSPGAVRGEAVFSVKKFEELVAADKPAILIIDYADKANFHAVLNHSDNEVGIITNFGTSRSHIGIMTNKRLIPAVINSQLSIADGVLSIDEVVIKEGDVIVLDGNNARVLKTDAVDILEEDRAIARIAIQDDVHENRRNFLEMGEYLNPASELLKEYTAEQILSMNWSDREAVISREQAAALMKSEYSFGRLLEMNWRAYRVFLQAELAEKKDPEDELLHIETDVRTQEKTFTHELLSLRGYAEGLSQKETDTLHEEYITGNKHHKYLSEVVYTRKVSAVDWELVTGTVREEIEAEIKALMERDPALIFDLRKSKDRGQDTEYTVVLIRASTKEEPVDIEKFIRDQGGEDLIARLPEESQTPVSPMLRYNDDLRFLFILGDHQVLDSVGDIVSVQDDFWSPTEMHKRVKDIQEFVEEKAPGKFRLKTSTNELRGHQRKGNGYIGFSFWFTQDRDIDEETLAAHRQRPSIWTVAMNGGKEESLDLVRKRLLKLTKSIPGLHLDEVIYPYQFKFGAKDESSTRNRHVFKIWREYLDPDQLDRVQQLVKASLLEQPADIRDLAYFNGDVHRVSFPSYSFSIQTVEDHIDSMLQLNSDYLPVLKKQAVIDGLTILMAQLQKSGFNPSDDMEEDNPEYLDIEIVNNVSGEFQYGSARTLFKNLPFVFGMKDHDSVKHFNFYKRAIVVSLEMLMNIGVRGSINHVELNQLNHAIKETTFEHREPRDVAKILSDAELADVDQDAAMSSADIDWEDVKQDGYDIVVETLQTDKAPQSFRVQVTKDGEPLERDQYEQESDVTYHVFPEFKLIVLETLYPNFPAPGSKDFVEGRGQALFRHLFNSNDLNGYHIVGIATRDARKSIGKMQEYLIDANDPEIVALDGTADLIEFNLNYVNFAEAILNSDRLDVLAKSQRDYLTKYLKMATVHVRIPSPEVDRAMYSQSKLFTVENWQPGDIVRSRKFDTEWKVDAFMQYQSSYGLGEIPAITLRQVSRLDTKSVDSVDQHYVFDRRLISSADELARVYENPQLNGIALDISALEDLIDIEDGRINRSFVMPNGKNWKGDNRLRFETENVTRVIQRVYFSADDKVEAIALEGYVPRGRELVLEEQRFWRWTGSEFKFVTLNDELLRFYSSSVSEDIKELDLTKLLGHHYLASAEIPESFVMPDGTKFGKVGVGFKFGARDIDRITMSLARNSVGEVEAIIFSGYQNQDGYEVKVRDSVWQWKNGLLQYVGPNQLILQAYGNVDDIVEPRIDLGNLLGYQGLKLSKLPGTFALPNGEIIGQGNYFSMRLGIRALSRAEMIVRHREGQVAGIRFEGFRENEEGEYLAGYSEFDWNGEKLEFRKNSVEDKQDIIRNIYKYKGAKSDTVDISDYLGARNLKRGLLNQGFPLPDGKTLGVISSIGVGVDLEKVEMIVRRKNNEYQLEFIGYQTDQASGRLEEVDRVFWKQLDGTFSRTGELIELQRAMQTHMSRPEYHGKKLDITRFFSDNFLKFGIFPKGFPYANGSRWIQGQKRMRLGENLRKVMLVPEFVDDHLRGIKLQAERNVDGEVVKSSSFWLADTNGFVYDDGAHAIRSAYKNTEQHEDVFIDVTGYISESALTAGQIPAAFPLPNGTSWGFVDFMRLGRNLTKVVMKVEFEEDLVTVKGITFTGYRPRIRRYVEVGKTYWEWTGQRFKFKYKSGVIEDKIRGLYAYKGTNKSKTIDITQMFGEAGLRQGRIKSTFPLPNGNMWGGKNIRSMMIGENLSKIKLKVRYFSDNSIATITFVGYKRVDGIHKFHRESLWTWADGKFTYRIPAAERNKQAIPDKIRELYESGSENNSVLNITEFVGTTGLEHGRLNRNFPLPNGKTLGKIQTLRLGSRKTDLDSMLLRVKFNRDGVPHQLIFIAIPKTETGDEFILRSHFNIVDDGLEFDRLEKEAVTESRNQSPDDKAMVSEAPGGIDLNPNHLDLNTQGQLIERDYSLTPQQLQQLDIRGYVPVIINITPVHNIPLLLGLTTSKDEEFSTVSPVNSRQPADRKQRQIQTAIRQISRLD